MLPISSTQLPGGSHGADSYRCNVEYPRYCDLCTRDVRKFFNRFEFAQHLRAMHCTKEGGSFICRYGPNRVCQTLPLEGVSDRDYEAHIRKCHADCGEQFHRKFLYQSAPESYLGIGYII
uniref:C2H2-type domain-containing protein n=1 Tax=Elaeophora elaphi TaxID=1147741 RepID=A0A0R3RKK2_9BILA